MKCPDCSRHWEYGPGEVDWYQARNWIPPMRCRECRELRRAGRAPNEGRRLVGAVTTLVEDRGYAFLRDQLGRAYFVRLEQVAIEAMPLRPGDRVTFVPGPTPPGRAAPRCPRALSVRSYRGEA